MLTQRTHALGRKRKGMVLFAVLVIVVILTLAAYQLSELMMAEYRAADSYRRSVQARALADSGVAYSAALLANPESFQTTLGGNPYDNAGAFQGILVHDSEFSRFRGRFSVIALPDVDGGTAFRYGVMDECGKLNINALLKLDSSGNQASRLLMTLPNMTEEIANSILDWIDTDEDTRSNGGENDYYGTLEPSYRCKNGPLDTLEELLLVKGVTPGLLFGNDRNRNGTVDADEDDGSGAADRGWSAYLTVFSREQNVDSTGLPRLYINDQDLTALYEKLNTALKEELANYIIAYRTYGPAQSNSSSQQGGSSSQQGSSSGQQASSGGASSSGSGQSSNSSQQNSSSQQSTSSTQTSRNAAPGERLSRGQATGTGGGFSGGGSGGGGFSAGGGSGSGGAGQRRGRPRAISSLFELVGSSVSIPGQGQNAQATIYPSPLNDPAAQRELLPLLLDKCTTVKDAELPARVNVNTAPAAVLAALPGMQEADVQNIIQKRPSPGAAADPIYQTPAWMISEANFRPEQMRTLERYITARSQVYRVQVLGYFDGGGPSVRVEAVIDTNAGRPRVSYWRDLTELGRGYEVTPPEQ